MTALLSSVSGPTRRESKSCSRRSDNISPKEYPSSVGPVPIWGSLHRLRDFFRNSFNNSLAFDNSLARCGSIERTWDGRRLDDFHLRNFFPIRHFKFLQLPRRDEHTGVERSDEFIVARYRAVKTAAHADEVVRHGLEPVMKLRAELPNGSRVLGE